MAKEIERSWHVDTERMPNLSGVPYEDIVQTYFTPWPPDPRYPEAADGEWRIRQTTDMDKHVSYQATVKFGDKASGSRQEFQTDLELGAGDSDIMRYGLAQVKKRRYKLPGGIELDGFVPNLHGNLWLAEKEFPDRSSMDSWQPPNWFAEVNDVKNRELAVPASFSGTLTHESIIGKPLARILHEAIQRRDRQKHLVVTVSGFSASGKTTLARTIAEELCAPLISADDYHVGATVLNDRYGVVNHDWPKTYDMARVDNDVRSLVDGKTVELPQYDFVAAEPTGETKTLAPSDSKIIVVEGLYTYMTGRRRFLETYNIFMNTPLYVSVLRRLKRDRDHVDDEDPNQRKIGWTQQEAMDYLMNTALPTYLRNCDAMKPDFSPKNFAGFDAVVQ